MQAKIRYYDGTPPKIAEVRFARHESDFGDVSYVVSVDGDEVGRVEKAEERAPVYATGRIAAGYTVRKGYKARARYATVRRTRLAAVADLLDGVAEVRRADR